MERAIHRSVDGCSPKESIPASTYRMNPARPLATSMLTEETNWELAREERSSLPQIEVGDGNDPLP
jgi:hypothetical protein